MGPGYSVVVQGAPQMVSSLRATAEPGAHNEPSEADPNDRSSDSDSSDDKISDLHFRVCQIGQSKQESRTKSMVYASWADTLDCQTPALKSLHNFSVVDLRSQGGTEVDAECL